MTATAIIDSSITRRHRVVIGGRTYTFRAQYRILEFLRKMIREGLVKSVDWRRYV